MSRLSDRQDAYGHAMLDFHLRKGGYEVNLREEEIIADFANVVEGKEKRPEIIAKVVTWSLFHVWPGDLNYFVNAQARERLLISVLAVRLYKMEKGRYPQRLDELVPQYLDEVPLDPFDLKPLRYKKRQGKWIIYSIGPDCKDDGGVKNYVHREAEEGADLIFEVE